MDGGLVANTRYRLLGVQHSREPLQSLMLYISGEEKSDKDATTVGREALDDLIRLSAWWRSCWPFQGRRSHREATESSPEWTAAPGESR
jgi:hypothetical protein